MHWGKKLNKTPHTLKKLIAGLELHLGIDLDTRGRLFYADLILVTTSLARHPLHFEGCGPFLLTGTGDHTPGRAGVYAQMIIIFTKGVGLSRDPQK